jgi:hypothetical protein
MDEFAAGQLLDWYERIESGILTFAEHVPLVSENDGFQAPMLASYLIDAAGLIDSVFRDMTKEMNEVSRGSIKRDDCNIIDFYELHNTNLDLNNTRSIMLVSPARTRFPFSMWKDRYATLPWWKAYNDLKHDRLTNIRVSTVGAALDALSGLHQVISRRIDLVPMLIRRGWLSTGNWALHAVIEEAGRGKLPDVFVVQTSLFATPVGARRGVGNSEAHFPQDLKDLRPHFFQAGMDFYKFFGSTG